MEPPPHPPPPPPTLHHPLLSFSFFFLFWRRLACVLSLGGGQAGLGRTGRASGDTLSVNLLQPQSHTSMDNWVSARPHTHTHTLLDWSQSPPSACLYVGLLYHGMCYINVWMRMNWCWNESFDIWKVQKVRLLQAVRAGVSLKKSLEGSLYSKCCLASDSRELWKPMFLFLHICVKLTVPGLVLNRKGRKRLLPLQYIIICQLNALVLQNSTSSQFWKDKAKLFCNSFPKRTEWLYF